MAKRSDAKRAPAPPMLPMQYSLRSPSHMPDVFDSLAHAAEDEELQQFIMKQFSAQTSYVQSLLQGLERRIVDSLRDSVECSPNCASVSPLRHDAMIEGVPPAPRLQPEYFEHLPGILNSDPEPAPQLSAGSAACSRSYVVSKRAYAPRVSVASSDSSFSEETMSNERKGSKPSVQDEAQSELNEVNKERPRRMSRVEDEMRQMMEYASTRTAHEHVQKSKTTITIHDRCECLVNSRPSELLISFLILSNAMIIGAQADIQMRNPAENVDRSTAFRLLEIFFTVVFLFELILRIMAERIARFLSIRNPNVHWNVFDFCLVASSIIEEVLNFMMDSTPDVSMLRMFRIVRLVRLFRIVRVMRFFQDLRIMVAGIANSMQSLVWALLLLFCVMYLVAVCVLQFAAEEGMSRAKSSSSGNLSDDDYDALQQYFGSLGITLYTLYMSITGGVDWGEAAEPLFAVGWSLGCFYISYTAFSVLCVLNIVTGVFVENCNKMTAKDEELVYMEQMEQRRQWYEEVKEMFQTAASDKSGYLDAKEFSEKVQGDVRMRAWMQKIGVHVEAYSAGGLFKLMDLDGDGLLDFDEFATALQQVHGQARSIDVAKVLHDTKALRRLLVALIEKLAPEGFADSKILRSQTKALDAYFVKNQAQPADMRESLTPESTDGNRDELV